MPLPAIHITDAACEVLGAAAAQSDGQPLRISISDRFAYDLRFDTAREGDVVVTVGELSFVLDADSASRADGMTIDHASGPDTTGFAIDNPNQPPRIEQLAAPDLQALIAAGESFELVDVRTPEERDIASIPGSRLLDQAYHDHLLTLDRSTHLVFQCHHGMRSQAAAEYFQQRGFRRLSNLHGGIDAWSLTVDSTVPRY